MRIWKVAFEPGTQNGVSSTDPISVPALSALTDRAFLSIQLPQMLTEAEFFRELRWYRVYLLILRP